jgi:hypothetical protein
MDHDKIAELIKAAPEVAREAYTDLASDTFKQAGKLGEDIAKTLRLILFPLQFTAALQDRLITYINRAVRQVPEPQLIAPAQSLMLPIVEKLRFQEAESPITDMYINLLSRAMDGERVGEAHPAFVGVISQLAPDEVVFLRELSRRDYTLIIKMDLDWSTPNAEKTEEIISGLPPQVIEKSRSIIFSYQSLNQPELFYVFLEHLFHLGLVQYVNEPIVNGAYKGIPRMGTPTLVFIRLSAFGNLFHKACISNAASEVS